MKKIIGIVIGLLVIGFILISSQSSKTVNIGEFHEFSKDTEVKVVAIVKGGSSTIQRMPSQEGFKEIFEYLISLESDETKTYEMDETVTTKPSYYRIMVMMDNMLADAGISIGEDHIFIDGSEKVGRTIHIVNKDKMSTLIEMLNSYYESVVE